jgi:hypothetical protein
VNDAMDEHEEQWERDLCKALAELPQEHAPRGLQRKLAAIPRRGRWPWLAGWRPAWALILLAAPLALVIGVQQQRIEQREQALARQAQQIDEARRELALALSYLDKANEIAGRQIADVLESGLARPVKENTVYGLQKPLEITREL